jgi:hypothetical protein
LRSEIKDTVGMNLREKKLGEDFLNSKMMRNWIISRLPNLTYEQVELLYGMIKRWTKEEEVS